MIVLGLHFGHDASVTIVKDGEVVLTVERERLNRVKRAITLTYEDIKLCLNDAGISLDEIDYCSLTSTQMVEYLFTEPEKLSVTLDPHPKHNLPCSMVDGLSVNPEDMAATASGVLESNLSDPANYQRRLFSKDFDFNRPSEQFFGGFEHFIQSPIWEKQRTLAEYSGPHRQDKLLTCLR